MAYMNQEKKKTLAPKIKEILKKQGKLEIISEETLKDKIMLIQLGQPVDLTELSVEDLCYLRDNYKFRTFINSISNRVDPDLSSYPEYSKLPHRPGFSRTRQTVYCDLPFQITTPTHVYKSVQTVTVLEFSYWSHTGQLVLRDYLINEISRRKYVD